MQTKPGFVYVDARDPKAQVVDSTDFFLSLMKPNWVERFHEAAEVYYNVTGKKPVLVIDHIDQLLEEHLQNPRKLHNGFIFSLTIMAFIILNNCLISLFFFFL